MSRRTNVALLLVLAVAFLTGWTAFAFANAGSRWSLVVHSVAGLAVVALVPWKSVVAQRGVARRRPGWWVSLLLGVVVFVSILGGLAHATGVLPWVGWLTAMEVHVGAAFVAVPLVVWHVVARPLRLRRTDLARRHLLRGAGLLLVAGAAYGASEVVVRATGLPGAGRRFTGSYEVGSFSPDQLPVTQWLFDPVPEVSSSNWRLLVELGPERIWVPYSELSRYSDEVRATLDCTGGFWSEQDWEGVWLSRLTAGSSAGALSVRVVSVTGYSRRFDVSLAPRLLLATRLGGQALDAGHGHPVRLVVPERRGFEWVKWVASVHFEAVPWWWQPPFPLR